VRTIKVPTLILWGAEDRSVPGSYAERFHLEADRPGVGHVPMEELSGESSRDAAAFLAAN
jgi:pimeloyl-ACP methyl ester carboxylesterase